MTLEEIQVAAYDFQRIPDADLPAPECLLWYMLRDIYDRFNNKIITKAEGEAEKQKAMQRYRENKSKLDMGEKVLRQNADLWQNIEIAADRYRTNRTLENADAFIEAVYGVGIKKSFRQEGGDTA